MSKLIMDSTQAKAYSSCPMLYYLNYVKCLRKAEYAEDSVDIRFGSAVHDALELFDEKNTDEVAVYEKFKESFVDLPGEDVKTLENGLLLLKHFLQYYRQNFSEWETLQKEEVGVTNIGDIEYICKIDRVVKWRDNIYCVDFKTTKSTRKHNFFDKFKLDFQPSGYIKWVKEKYGQCSGFIPIGMFMGCRKRAYKGEPAGFHCSFDYTIVNRTALDLQFFEEDIRKIRNEIVENKGNGCWRRNPGHCGSWRGCQYAQLCESCYDESVQSSFYEVFNPNEYLNIDKKEA